MGTGGREPERKGVGEAGVPSWQEPGEIEKILQHFVIFRNRNGTKRQEAGVKVTGRGKRRYRKQEFQTPLFLPTILNTTTLNTYSIINKQRSKQANDRWMNQLAEGTCV